MKSWLEIREAIERIDKFLEHHGGPFGEGVEPHIAYMLALKWVLAEGDPDALSVGSVLGIEV